MPRLPGYALTPGLKEEINSMVIAAKRDFRHITARLLARVHVGEPAILCSPGQPPLSSGRLMRR